MSTPNPEGSYSFLALGDSYTVGQSMRERERWPVQLAGALRERGIQVADPEIIARTGWTTADLLRAIEANGDLGSYDLVSILIGVNDQFQGLSIEGYRARFRELLALAIKAAKGNPERVIVLSIPDWSYTPYGESLGDAEVSAKIDEFNTIAREEGDLAGVNFFDITPTTRPRIYDAELFADDGLHPSGKMYSTWVEVILADIVEIFRGD
jgi:lysophospholipase L1-like esterase